MNISDDSGGVNTGPPKIDLDEAGRFLDALAPGSMFRFQVVKDIEYSDVFPGHFQGSLEDCKGKLLTINRKGGGCFVTVNQTDGKGRRAENVTRIRAIFLDLDGSPLEPVRATGVIPHVVVETSPGKFHVYWWADDCPVDQFKPIQEALATKFNGDSSVKDPSRVLRIPGFLHQKAKRGETPRPFQSRIVELRTREELPPYAVADLVTRLGLGLSASTATEKRDNTTVAPDGKILDGTRNVFLCSVAGSLRNQGLTGEALCEALQGVNQAACNPPETDERIREIAGWASGKTASELKTEKLSALEIARLIRSGEHIRNINGRLYRYSGGRYEFLFPEETDKRVIEIAGERVGLAMLGNVHRLLASEVFDPDIRSNLPDRLNLKNGLLDPITLDIEPHSPDRVYTTQIDITFDPTALCPLWRQTVGEMLPNPVEQLLLAQIFGYALTPDISHQKGFFLLGGGANGKSLTTDILLALLGPDNCASLSLDDLAERFRLAELQDRLVNVVSEVPARGLIQDSKLKPLLSGDPVTVERKYERPFSLRNFARLIISCNNLPASADKSYGYLRRWIILKFSQAFTDQNRNRDPHRAQRITDTEMPGLLNWALAGLRRLHEDGVFAEPESSSAALEEYRRQIDPTIEFLEEETALHDPSIPGTPLEVVFDKYQQWARDARVKALGRNGFYRQCEQHTNRSTYKPRAAGRQIPGLVLR